MKKDLNWFLDRVDTFIQRGTTDIYLKDATMAQELFKLQSDSYVFDVKMRVHRAPQEECESCSA